MRCTSISLCAAATLNLIVLVFLGSFVSQGRLAIAAPLSDGDSNTGLIDRSPSNLGPRYVVPSTSEIVALIDKAGVIGTKTSVFWTAFTYVNTPIMQQGYMTAKAWARERFGNDFLLYDQAMSTHDYMKLTSSYADDMPSDAQDRERIQHMSKAFARRSTGTVYVLIPDGEEPNDSSYWKIWEAPVLTRTGRVDEIIRVGWPSREEQSLWTSGQPALYEASPPGKL